MVNVWRKAASFDAARAQAVDLDLHDRAQPAHRPAAPSARRARGRTKRSDGADDVTTCWRRWCTTPRARTSRSMRRGAKRAVREALRQLAPEQVQILRLSFYDEQSHARIAGELQRAAGHREVAHPAGGGPSAPPAARNRTMIPTTRATSCCSPRAAGTLDAGATIVLGAHLEGCAHCRASAASVRSRRRGDAGVDRAGVDGARCAGQDAGGDRCAASPGARPPRRRCRGRACRPASPGRAAWPVARVSRWHWMGPGMRWSRVTLPHAPDGQRVPAAHRRGQGAGHAHAQRAGADARDVRLVPRRPRALRCRRLRCRRRRRAPSAGAGSRRRMHLPGHRCRAGWCSTARSRAGSARWSASSGRRLTREPRQRERGAAGGAGGDGAGEGAPRKVDQASRAMASRAAWPGW